MQHAVRLRDGLARRWAGGLFDFFLELAAKDLGGQGNGIQMVGTSDLAVLDAQAAGAD